MKFIFTLAAIFAVITANAATNTAATCQFVDVSNAVALSVSGDTVLVPAGVATWTNVLQINANIQIIGAGIGQTILTNYSPKNVGNDAIVWVTTNNGPICRFSGFSLRCNNLTPNWFNIQGSAHNFSAENCDFDASVNSAFVLYNGWVYGCWDHINFTRVHVPFNVHHDAYGGYVNGNGSWSDADSWGTTNAVYIEACNFTNNPGDGFGIADGEGGARIVIRYCNGVNVFEGTHGTDSTGASRGARTIEFYGNNLQWATNQTPSTFYVALQIRAGTALVFSNTVVGGYQELVGASVFRPNCLSYYVPWGPATGGNPWDSNNATIFDSGTTTSTATNVVDTTKSWTVNQWQNYQFWNTNQGWGTIIFSNSATTLFYVSTDVSYGTQNFLVYTNNSGDHYQIRKINAVIDQFGFGQGDLLISDVTGTYATNSVTGGSAWPHEVSDPVYVWANNYTNQNGPGVLVGTNTTVLAGRDFVTGTPKPGFTPLGYPHPLDLGATYVVVTNVSAALTNLIKISQLPTASTLTGTELVPLLQAGQTRASTVSQINAPGVALANLYDYYFLQVDATNKASIAALSNNIATTATSTSNALASALAATNSQILSVVSANSNANAAAMATMSGTISANAAAASSALASTNAALLGAIASVANGGAITNGGSASFTSVSYSPFATSASTVVSAGNTAVTINLAAASLQVVTLTNLGHWFLYATNQAAGQNVTVLLRNATAGGYYVFYPTGMVSMNVGTYLTLAPKKACAFNFACPDANYSNVVFSLSLQQN